MIDLQPTNIISKMRRKRQRFPEWFTVADCAGLLEVSNTQAHTAISHLLKHGDLERDSSRLGRKSALTLYRFKAAK